MNRPILTISLDFELHWGRFDKANILGNEKYYIQTREVIPEILKLFKAFNIEATWATVGMLFAKDQKEWEKYSPVDKPTYHQPDFSAYHWLGKNQVQDKFIFAPDLIGKILQTDGQELGSHTFSHYYTLAKGQTENQFRQDLQAANLIAQEKFKIKLSSLVFPRNQFNSTYLNICMEEGFSVIRSNPKDWYWKATQEERLVKRIFRTGDTLLPLGKKSSYPLSDIKMKGGYPLMLPASRFLKPYSPHYPALNRWKMNRVRQELIRAAKEGRIFHLWWHPHNFGAYPAQSLQELREILMIFKKLETEYGMISRNMKHVGDMVCSSRILMV